MRHRITTRVRRNVVGYLALFVALAGTSAAAAGLKPSDGQGVPAPPAGAAAPTSPASSKLTVPFVVGTLTEPGRSTQHKLSARFGVSCTKDGEDYTLEDVKVDVLKFN